MWRLADRVLNTVSDLTVGTVVVLVHIGLARRQRVPSERLVLLASTSDGTRIRRTQIRP